MAVKTKKTQKQLEYERDCLKECLKRDISRYSPEQQNVSLYYQFIKEDLDGVEHSLKDLGNS